jgi:tRNA pseudouridine-54 N-methylase
MTDKTFNVGGVSKTKGQYKVRFANDMTRVKILAKTDTDINLVDLPGAMTKAELVTHLKTTDLYKNPEYAAAIDAADAKYNTASTVKVNSTKPNMADIKARAAAKETADA